MTLETVTLFATIVEFLAVGCLAVIFLTLPAKWCDEFYSRGIGVYLLFDAGGNAIEVSERLGAFALPNPAIDDIVVAGSAVAIVLLLIIYAIRCSE